jgi:hypothetical protein
MSHLTEDDLVLHYYGEHDDSAAVAAHLESCPSCRAAEEAVRADLTAIDFDTPARDADYGRRVWERLAPRLNESAAAPARIGRRSRVGRVVTYLAIAASLVLAFLLGRHMPTHEDSARIAAGRERILETAVGAHLDRSQMLLVELAHADSSEPAAFAARAADLVAANRLYRQTALRAGDAGVAHLLDELERVLVEVANTPGLTADDIRELNDRIEKRGLLFKVRVVGSRLRERGAEPTVKGASSRS